MRYFCDLTIGPRFAMNDFLGAIPQAATSQYAIFAYVVAAVLFIYGGHGLRQLREIRKLRANALDSGGLKETIAAVIKEPVPPNMTADEWIRYKRHSSIFTLLLTFMLLIGVLLVIALTMRNADQKGKDQPSAPRPSPLTQYRPERFVRCLPLQIDPALELEKGNYKVIVHLNPAIAGATAKACFGKPGNGDGRPADCKGNDESVSLDDTTRLFGMLTNFGTFELEDKGLTCAPANDNSGYTMRALGKSGEIEFEVVLVMRRETGGRDGK
jgi:hypothetical protein